MIVLRENAWFCDVDDTLVMWGMRDHPEAKEFENCGFKELLVPHAKHIELLKQAKFRGHVVIVWSAGGADWAEEVVKKLGLESYVDVIVSKPDWFIDDLRAGEFMPEMNRVYIEDYKKKNRDQT